jgi:hypothetical protein
MPRASKQTSRVECFIEAKSKSTQKYQSLLRVVRSHNPREDVFLPERLSLLFSKEHRANKRTSC